MIIQNGTIEFIITKGGGIDATTGHPTTPTEEYLCPIPCQYEAVSYNAQAREETEAHTHSSYSILIEDMNRVKSERVRLRDRCFKIVGDFPIRQVKPLNAVCQVQLIV